MRFLFTGGGTGGHIYPAIAVAKQLKSEYPDSEILFVGSRRGIEAKAVPHSGFPIKFVSSCGFSKSPSRLLKFAYKNIFGTFQAIKVLLNFKPNLVIATGGFVSAPILTASLLLKIPYILMEQNVLPGKVTRLMSKGALKVLTSFEESKKYLKNAKVIFTGNPVRSEIIERKKEEGLKKLNIPEGYFVLSIVGGSQGAKSFNRAVHKALSLWNYKNWCVIHIVGRKNYSEYIKNIGEEAKKFKGIYKPLDYVEDMASLYAITDLIVARAGATTLAEITARGIPAILVPYPYAADNHQEKNAKFLSKEGAALVILDKDVEEKLAEEVERLYKDASLRHNMAQNMKRLGCPQALYKIIEEIKEVLN